MPRSMVYLQNLAHPQPRPCQVPESAPLQVWNIENIRILLAQSVVFLLGKCRLEFARWAGEIGVEKATISKMGVRLVQLARAHSIYFYYSSMLERITKVRDECLRGSLF
jgi:hypothetical protein